MGIKLAVDLIIEKEGKIVLIERGSPPFEGALCLPGGFVEEGETVEQAAIREAEEETSLIVRPKRILGVYSDPERDPRGHVVSVVFICEPVEGKLEAGGDAARAGWSKVEKIAPEDLGFDHKKIIKDYKRWRKEGLTYWSSL